MRRTVMQKIRLRDGRQYARGSATLLRDPKLAALVSLKGGVSIVGTSWVLFPVLAMRVFRLPVEGLNPERAALFGMSLLMGARGLGALIGPLVASHFTGQRENRLRIAALTRVYCRRHRLRCIGQYM